MTIGSKNKQNNPAKRYIPVVRVSFHTQNACYQTKGTVLDGDNFDPTNQVIAVNTQKSMSNPAGGFTVQLAGNEWVDLIQSNDLVVIQMGYRTTEGEKLNTVMVGLVDRVREVRSASNSSATTTITGRDFGKVLIKSQLKFYPELGQANPDAASGEKFFLTDEGWVTLMSFFNIDNTVEGTPAQILDIIMRYILPKLNTVEWTVYDETVTPPVPKKVDVTNVLRYNFAKVDVFLPLIMTADQFEGALWNLMERACIKPFTELFVDVRDDVESWNAGIAPRVVNETVEQASDDSKAVFPKGNGYYPVPRFSFGSDKSAVAVFLRNTPFDKGAWEALYTHDLLAEDVVEEDLSKSDDEHYNLFWAGTTITPFGSDFMLKKVAPPLWNEEDAKRYGLSPLEVNIEGLALNSTDSSQPPKLTEVSKSFSAKLKAWFENNHKYFNGSMTVRGKGNYKIGHRVRREGILKEFYLEGVSQSFNVFDKWETTLDLTRGMDLGGAPNSLDYAPSEVNAPSKPAGDKTEEEVRADYYTVKNGDSLWSIAAKSEVYGDGNKWALIWEENKDLLTERDSRNVSDHGKYLYVGQTLRIPKG